jgi:hypothetical protein
VNASGPRRGDVSRIRLEAEELARLAELCGTDAPTGHPPTRDVRTGLSVRLGGDAPVPPAVLAGRRRPIDDRLRRHGVLMPDGQVLPAVAQALALWSVAGAVVEFTLVIELPGVAGQVLVRSEHRAHGTGVVCLSSAGGAPYELAWTDSEGWSHELARVAVTEPAHASLAVPGAGHPASPVPSVRPVPSVVEVPWELLLAATEAYASGRDDVAAELLREHAGLVRGGAPGRLAAATEAEAGWWVRTLAVDIRGCLRGRVLVPPSRVGLLEWVLHDDGWREVRPGNRDGWRTARLVTVRPVDLAHRVAGLVTGSAA